MKTTSPKNPRLEFLQLPANHSREVSIPTGLCPSAQGCEERTTLGVRIERIPTPAGLWQSRGDRCNPVGVGEFFRLGPRVARSSQPWAEGWNPVGIQDSAPLRFIVTAVFVVMLLATTTLRAQIVNDGATNTLANV